MGLDAVIRSGVATAKAVTTALQCTVTHEPWASQNAYGEAVYGVAASRIAVVDFKQKLVRNALGQEVLSTATVMFVGDVTVDLKDRITLPGGLTSPILAVEGILDPTSGRPYAPLVYLS